MLYIYPSRQNFFVINKISYLQLFRENMRGQNSVTTTNNNEQQQRTPRTIIIPRQDSFRILELISNVPDVYKSYCQAHLENVKFLLTGSNCNLGINWPRFFQNCPNEVRAIWKDRGQFMSPNCILSQLISVLLITIL